MGKRNEMAQTFDSRNVPSPTAIPDREEEEQKIIIKALFKIIGRFFGGMGVMWQQVSDPRDLKKITYPLSSLLFAGILMFLCRLGARRQMGFMLRNSRSVEKFFALFNVASFPHGDTLNEVFKRLDPDQIQQIPSWMVETLIRKKHLYPYRLFERFFVIAVDGTGLVSYRKRHCPHCLTRTQNGKTLYYHNVLEAKLVTPNGFSFSLMSEFIENPADQATKQDCELKAFYRLAERLKARFPRLPILLSLDGLFAGGPTMGLCKKFGWRYMIVLKDKDLASVNEEFESLSKIETENHLSWQTGQGGTVKQKFRWVNDIPYVDTNKKEHLLAVLECVQTHQNGNKQIKQTKFKWITNRKIKSNSVIELANDGGRIRWKIENEGFNVQKNGGYGLEHAYTNHWTSSKVFYYLLQIAHLLAQLLEKTSMLRQTFPKGFGSDKNLAFRLLEAWRNVKISKDACLAAIQNPCQIRFDTS